MSDAPSTPRLLPLYLAGFTTAFGAHGVAAVLGAESDGIGLALLSFGLMLALYDIAEVLLKPVFGALADRIGVRPVILGGLIAFAALSLLPLISATPAMLAVARLGQGAAASAFSPAASAAVARLAGPGRLGGYFGRYGAWKSLGYTLGPVLGIALAAATDVPTVFLALAALATLVAAYVLIALPAIPVVPRKRYTLLDVIRQSTAPAFIVPSFLLAVTTGILGVAVGFLPLLATRWDVPAIVGGAAVATLALVSTAAQPLVGAVRDRGGFNPRIACLAAFAGTAAALCLLAFVPHVWTLFVAAIAVGALVGIATPIAFAMLAASTPEDRLGRTMGSAELVRELGDAGGPLLVGGIATAVSLPLAFVTLAAVALGAGGLSLGVRQSNG